MEEPLESSLSRGVILRLAAWLLVAAALPFLLVHLRDGEWDKAIGALLTVHLLYPLIAGLGLIALSWLPPQWLRALGLLALAAPFIVLGAIQGWASVTGGLVQSLHQWDLLLLGSIAGLFITTLLIAHGRISFFTVLLCMAFGGLLLAWGLVERPLSIYEMWFGLDQVKTQSNIPIVRAFQANWAFPKGTSSSHYFLWNAMLVVYGLTTVGSLLLPLAWSKKSYGFQIHVFLYVLLFWIVWSPAITVVAQLFSSENRLTFREGCEAIAQAIQLRLAPIALVALVLLSITEVLLQILPEHAPGPGERIG